MNGKLLIVDFYNGKPLDVGLRRSAPEILQGDLEVAILPLQKDAPIYLASRAKPDFDGKKASLRLKRVEIIPRYHIELKTR